MNKTDYFITSYKDITSNNLTPLPINPSETSSFFIQSKNEIWSLSSINEITNEMICNVWLIYKINEKKQSYVTRIKKIPQDTIIGNNNKLFYNIKHNEVFIFSSPITNEYVQKEEYSLYSYDLNNNVWKLLFLFPKELYLRQIIGIYNNSLIAIAYINKNRYFLKFEFDSNKFNLNEILAPIPELGFSTIFVESKIFLYSGIDKNEKCSNKIWIINPENFNIIESHIITNVTPRTFSFGCYISKYESIFFYGGTTNGYDAIDSGFLFNVIDKSIQPIEKIFNCDSIFKFSYDDINQDLYLVKCWNYDLEFRKYYTRFNEIKKISFNKH